MHFVVICQLELYFGIWRAQKLKPYDLLLAN